EFIKTMPKDRMKDISYIVSRAHAALTGAAADRKPDLEDIEKCGDAMRICYAQHTFNTQSLNVLYQRYKGIFPNNYEIVGALDKFMDLLKKDEIIFPQAQQGLIDSIKDIKNYFKDYFK